TSATEATSEGRPEMFLASIPPDPTGAEAAPDEIALTHPGVFFGPTDQEYAIVTPRPDQFLGPDGQPGDVGTDLPQGISLRSRALRLLLAWGFQDPNLFFSSEIGTESQFVIYRGIQSRVQRIAPFLAYLEGPQATIHDGRVVWILDGFTSSAHYPLSSRFTVSFRRAVNYLRASVKVTVDAVTGEVRFYVVDPDDPILAAYSRVFPELFNPLSELDPELRDHLRYPKSLLTVQAGVLQAYHQETPGQFHGQEDMWTTPQETGRGTASVEYRPEYAWYRLPEATEPEFLLSTVFVPVGLQNLTAALIARSDPDVYGQLRLYEFRVEDGVPGPRQVEALIEQDPIISQQFSLWRQGGSQVWTGHLHLIPVGDRILYMEPVFLAAEEDAIPELRRFVVSDGTRVAMEETLSGALEALSGGFTPTPQGGAPDPSEETWISGDALQLLDAAEEALREGDWTGFGAALERLRQVLENAGEAVSSPSPSGSP
ncbi:MAG: COG1615 family transporter, partial [Gemmatimonadetes bacterium]|nr:COG1615 family transporter [Gemmatimonadota bacterium]